MEATSLTQGEPLTGIQNCNDVLARTRLLMDKQQLEQAWLTLLWRIGMADHNRDLVLRLREFAEELGLPAPPPPEALDYFNDNQAWVDYMITNGLRKE